MACRILVVDDDPFAASGLARLLERRGYVVREENDGRRALAATREFAAQVVILDFLMPQCHGGDVAWQIASDPTLRSVQLIVCSALTQREIAPLLPPVRIPILSKPVEIDRLLKLLPVLSARENVLARPGAGDDTIAQAAHPLSQNRGLTRRGGIRQMRYRLVVRARPGRVRILLVPSGRTIPGPRCPVPVIRGGRNPVPENVKRDALKIA